MKRNILLLMLCLGARFGFAGLSDLDFKAEAKCLDRDKASTGSTEKTVSKWVYEVTAENKSTKDFANLEVKYIVFVKDVISGSRSGAARLVRKEGATTAAAIKSHDKFTFQTDPVDLVKTQLAGGWTYASGARPRASDSLEGIWVRVFEGTKQIAEFALPAGLPGKEKWEAPAKPAKK